MTLDVDTSESELPQLRPIVHADWPAVHAWATREEVYRFQIWGPNTENDSVAFVRTAADAWLERPQVRFAYALTLGEQVVGCGELNLRGDEQGEIGYVVHPDHWGRGIASRAAKEIVRRGFTDHGLHRIFATCDPRNEASAKVLTSLGMRHEGRMREAKMIRDGWRDSDLYALLASEFNSS